MPRRSSFHRHASVVVRTAHLGGVVGVMASALAHGSSDGWAELLIVSGCLLVVDDVWRFGIAWIRYLQAWVIVGKLAIFVACHVAGEPLVGLWLAMVSGSLVAHAPGAIRHLPLFGSPGPCSARSTHALSSSTSRAPGALR